MAKNDKKLSKIYSAGTGVFVDSTVREQLGELAIQCLDDAARLLRSAGFEEDRGKRKRENPDYYRAMAKRLAIAASALMGE